MGGAEPAAAHASSPTAFVLHASRCGSTLVGRMLAELDAAVVVDEPPAVDRALRGGDGPAAVGAAVAGLAAAAPPGSRVFVKLDSWSVLDLESIRDAYPRVPWLFVYRRPAEIVASHLRERGMQTVPGELPAELFGLDPASATAVTAEEYCARVIGSILEAAARGLDDRCALVDYAELPAALPDLVLPRIGLSCTHEERRRMLAVARFDAKRPGLTFAPNGASPAPRAGAAARRWAAEPFALLEAARAAQRAGSC
jgi:hypothetical protein